MYLGPQMCSLDFGVKGQGQSRQWPEKLVNTISQNQLREFHPVLVTGVFGFADVLISFWDQKFKVTAGIDPKNRLKSTRHGSLDMSVWVNNWQIFCREEDKIVISIVTRALSNIHSLSICLCKSCNKLISSDGQIKNVNVKSQIFGQTDLNLSAKCQWHIESQIMLVQILNLKSQSK